MASCAGVTFETKELANIAEANSVLGVNVQNNAVLKCCQLLFESGVSKVTLVNTENNITKAIARLGKVKELGLIVADIDGLNDPETLIEWVEAQAKNQKETICFFARSTFLEAKNLANLGNHERIVVTFPEAVYEGQSNKLFGACALVGRILTENRPNFSLNGVGLDLLEGVSTETESNIQSLIQNGVSVLETMGEKVECIRG